MIFEGENGTSVELTKEVVVGEQMRIPSQRNAFNFSRDYD